MAKIDVLEEHVRAAVKTVHSLRERNLKLQTEYQKLKEENELLHSENRQVRKMMVELDRLREERRLVRHKCEKALARLAQA